MTIKVVAGPTLKPLELAEAKQHCRIDTTADDTLVTALIDAAMIKAEEITRRALLTQTLEEYYDDWPSGDRPIYIHRPPIQSLAWLRYYDTLGQEFALDLNSGAYAVDLIGEPGRVALCSGWAWPMATLRSVNGIALRYTAGWTSADAIPRTIKQAMLIMIGAWYENREAGDDVPAAALGLLRGGDSRILTF